MKCYWLLCVSWPIASCYGREYLFEWDVTALTERDHFQRLKPYVYSLLCIKTSYGFRRLGMQHDLFVMLLYCLFMVSFCNKYLWLHLYQLYVLYCSEMGRFRVGVGLGAPMINDQGSWSSVNMWRVGSENVLFTATHFGACPFKC